MSAPSHRISWPKGNEKCPLQRVTLGAVARQTQQQQGLVHGPISLFSVSLCKSSAFVAAPGHFPTGLSQATSSCQKSLFSWISIFKLGRRNFDFFCLLQMDRLTVPGRGNSPITSSSVWAWEIPSNQELHGNLPISQCGEELTLLKQLHV